MTVPSLPPIRLWSRMPKSSEIRLAVSRQSPISQLRSKILWIGEVALEDEVAAVLDLPDGVKARQVDLMALGAGEFRSQDQCPVIELLLNDLGTKPGGGGLQGRDIVGGDKCVIVLAEGDLGFLEFLFDKGVAV